MILFPPEAPLEEPGCCFICEQSPDRKYVLMAATQRIFDPGIVRTNLNGMKYLCEECVRAAMVVFGFPQPETANAAIDTAAILDDELKDALKRLNTYAALDAQIRAITEEEKPIRKPRATKASAGVE